jgi:hypothetical protein
MNEWGGFCTAAVEAAVADQSVDWIPPMLLFLSMISSYPRREQWLNHGGPLARPRVTVAAESAAPDEERE